MEPHTVVKLSITLLSFNIALCFSRIISTAMPSDHAWHVAIV